MASNKHDTGQVAIGNGEQRRCSTCGAEWYPSRPADGDADLKVLCGFDVVRAMNILLEVQHQADTKAKPEARLCADPGRKRVAAEAWLRLHQVREDLGPERISQQAYVDVIGPLQEALGAFLPVAKSREHEETIYESHVYGEMESPKPSELSRAAIAAAEQLAPFLDALAQKWTLDFDGLTLPGTKAKRGRTTRALLGEIEGILAGGFSQSEIARLDLGGEGATVGGVRMRKKARRVTRDKLERDVDPAMLEAARELGFAQPKPRKE